MPSPEQALAPVFYTDVINVVIGAVLLTNHSFRQITVYDGWHEIGHTSVLKDIGSYSSQTKLDVLIGRQYAL